MALPILIVGAGPSGLVVALSLVQHGVPVRIIAKERQYRPGQRGAGVTPRTLELHHFLGTLPDILQKAAPVPPMRHYKSPGGTEVLRDFQMEMAADPTPDRPYVHAVMLGQETHEAILRAHLAKYDCQVELGTELVSLEQHHDHVSATISTTSDDGLITEKTEKYAWLVGADGGRSTVRKQLDEISFLGETRKDSVVVGDIHVKHGLDKDHWHCWGERTLNAATLRSTEADDDVFSFLVVDTPENNNKLVSSRNALLARFYESTQRTDIQFGDIVWVSLYTPNIRMVNKFNQGRVFLVGDAAHTHSPTGAQGMNSSVQDALNLGWKLALVHNNLASPALLSTYGAERLLVIAEMLNLTTALLDQIVTPGDPAKPDDSAWKRGGDFYQLGVNYRHSPVVVDERTSPAEKDQITSAYSVDRTQPVRAGDRAPNAIGLVASNGETTSVFDIFGSTVHTVLVFGNDTAFVASLQSTIQTTPAAANLKLVVITPKGTSLADVAGAETVVEDREGHAAVGYSYKWGTPAVFVVRPDGVIGAIVQGAQGLKGYFELVFAR